MFQRYLAIICLLVLAPTFASALAFVLEPRAFYYRPWEYFEEVGYRYQMAPLAWTGSETGDMSRQSLLFRQTSRTTHATTTLEGYRVTPEVFGHPRILVLGDSLAFGSGLSDWETMPWRLSQALGTGVFNGARRGGLCLLDWPENGDIDLVMEIHTERLVTPDEVTRRTICASEDGLLDRDTKPFWLFTVAPERYLLPLKLWRAAKVGAKDARALLAGTPFSELTAPLLHGDAVGPRDVTLAVARMREIHDQLRRRGIRYMAVAVPSSRTVAGEWKGAHAAMVSFHERLSRRLAATGIETVNLEPVFRQHTAAGGAPLFMPYDSHWSPAGAGLAAEAIAAAVRKKGLGPPAITSAMLTPAAASN